MRISDLSLENLVDDQTYLSNPGSIKLACPMINTDDEPTSQKKVDNGAANQSSGIPRQDQQRISPRPYSRVPEETYR
jgi:hypothetical protein